MEQSNFAFLIPRLVFLHVMVVVAASGAVLNKSSVYEHFCFQPDKVRKLLVFTMAGASVSVTTKFN